jgi:hypothetical protein
VPGLPSHHARSEKDMVVWTIYVICEVSKRV